MRSASIEMRGSADPLLCDCGSEIRQLKTLELSGALFVFDGFVYELSEQSESTKQEVDGIRLTTNRFATPVSFGDRSLRASAVCLDCRTQMTYQFAFDGNQVMSAEPTSARSMTKVAE